MPLLITISSCILFATFLALASFGIALETSDSVAEDVVKKLLVDFKISDSDLNELAHFAAQNNHIGAAFIVVGLVMAAVCLIGLISAQNEWKILLNMFAAILIILLFVEAIILVVYFAHPDKLATPLLHTMEELLETYTDVSSNNSMAKAVWNTVMREELKCDNHVYSKCCGINGYEDFGQRMLWLPRECCNSSFSCITSHAQAAGAPGCKDKLTACTVGYSKYLLCVAVFTLLIQNAFIVFPIAHVLLEKLDLNQ
ncbi:CD82 antigen [Taenia solium]|eukprot:TsM_000173000 transcript=TsM_000173000 gene=TsM_000173000